jgi:Carbohydrate family 9 binding domain-like
LFLIFPVAVAASIAPGQTVKAVKTTTPPPQDATLTDPVWSTALRATDFENATTREPARKATTALLLYDDKNLYVGFIVEQKDVPLTATQHTNDVGYGLDDEVTISIDSSGSNSRLYAFTSTPLGVRYEFSSESSRYQPPWTTVTKLTPDGYNVMMTIPIADMRLGNGKSQRWRINFSRFVGAFNELLTWAYESGSTSYCSNNANYGSTIYCDSTRWPILTDIALSGVSKAPPPYADVYALGSAGYDKDVFETTPLEFTSQNPRHFGLDATVPFTPSMAAVVALAPDFSNVETDQVTISPQEFAIQYTEYRPFFAQGSNYINSVGGFGVNGPSDLLFYSPSLGIVDYGAKVEGTEGKNIVGLLDTKGDGFNDQAFGYTFQQPDGTISLSLQGVNANHPDVTDHTIGFGGSYQNLHSGFQPIIIYEQETGTFVNAGSLGHLLNIGEVTNHGLWQSGFVYRDVGPDFNPVDGYTAINDIRGPQAFAVYTGLANQQSIIKSYRLDVVLDRFVDRSGAAHQVDTQEGASILFKNLLRVGFSTDASELRTYEEAYPFYTNGQNVAFDTNQLSLNYRDGTPSPTDFTYAFGPFAVSCEDLPSTPAPCADAVNEFAPAYTQQFNLTSTKAFAGGLAATATYAGTIERPFLGTMDSQFLRKISLSRALGADAQIALSFGTINGQGGFAAPGTNLAVSYHKRFRNQSQLYFEYGSPASYHTLQRFVLKYVYHIGAGGAGT